MSHAHAEHTEFRSGSRTTSREMPESSGRRSRDTKTPRGRRAHLRHRRLVVLIHDVFAPAIAEVLAQIIRETIVIVYDDHRSRSRGGARERRILSRARARRPRTLAEGALEDDAVDGVARRERRARVIAGTFATVVIPRRATVSRPRASTGLDDGARRRRAIRIRIVGRRVSRENTYSSSFEGYRRNRRHDRRVVVI